MARALDFTTDRIQTFVTCWEKLAPDAVFAGMTLAEFQQATAAPQAKRAEIGRVLATLTAKRQERDIADEEALAVVELVLNSVLGHLDYGPNSGLYSSLGYVTKAARKSGLVRKKIN